MTNLLVRLFVKSPQDTANPAVRAAYGRLAGLAGIVCNLLLVAGKLLAGFFSGSIAIMADAVNNLSDAASSVITLVGFRLAAKPADREHPFGHARFEYIAGLAVALLVMIIGVELGRGSIEKIIEPTPVAYSAVSFAVLGASILLKLWMAFFNRDIGRRIHSATLQATYADSRNDVLATAAVLVAAAIAAATGLNLDGYMGLAVAVFIVISGIGLVRDTLDPLLGAAPDPELVREIGEKIRRYGGVLGTHDLLVHDYGPGRVFASAHVEMSSSEDVLKSHDVIDKIERDFLEQEGIRLIIHYDPIVTGAAASHTARCRVEQLVQGIDPRLTIHDFRMVEGKEHDDYIFDVTVPQGFAMTQEQLTEQVEKALQTQQKSAHAVITIDTSFAAIPQ